MKQEEIAQIADWIRAQREKSSPNRVLVVTGPEGSGKTTFALAIAELLEKEIVPIGLGYHISRFIKGASKTIVFDGFTRGIPIGLDDEVVTAVSGGQTHFGEEPISFEGISVIVTAENFCVNDDLARRSLTIILPNLPVSDRVSERVAIHNIQLAIKKADWHWA